MKNQKKSKKIRLFYIVECNFINNQKPPHFSIINAVLKAQILQIYYQIMIQALQLMALQLFKQ